MTFDEIRRGSDVQRQAIGSICELALRPSASGLWFESVRSGRDDGGAKRRCRPRMADPIASSSTVAGRTMRRSFHATLQTDCGSSVASDRCFDSNLSQPPKSSSTASRGLRRCANDRRGLSSIQIPHWRNNSPTLEREAKQAPVTMRSTKSLRRNLDLS
jgi:hypothetical protein